MSFRRYTVLFLLLSIIGVSIFCGIKHASATINSQISFEGKLTNPDGTNVTDGNYSVRFRIYNSAAADALNACAANSCLWEETQSVDVNGGLFQENLGSVNPLPASMTFNVSGLYLGIKVSADAEMTPRVQFTASPQAFNSDLLDGLDATNFIQLGQSATAQVDASTNSSIFVNKTSASGNILQLQDSGVNVFTVGNAGQVTLQAATNATNAFQINDAAGTNTLFNVDTLNSKVLVGSATPDGVQTTFNVDGFSTFSDTLTCNATTNLGAMYYSGANFNTATGVATGSVRMCAGVAGAGTTATAGWTDLASTADLGAILFGVVPDSGNSTNAQDLISGITAGKSGPCKVSLASATTVNIEPCVAYSGGRRVIVNQQTAFAVTVTAGWTSICLSGTNGAPASINNASELLATPTFSATAPILCLATLKVSGTAITQAYDTRTFTTTDKEFVTTPTAAVGLGYLAQVDGAGVKPMATGASVGANGNTRGVVVATKGTTSSTAPSAIVAVRGPAFVKVTNIGATAGQFVESSVGTAGYGTSSATGSTAVYGNIGVARITAVATATCTATPNAANCIGSTYVNVLPR